MKTIRISERRIDLALKKLNEEGYRELQEIIRTAKKKTLKRIQETGQEGNPEKWFYYYPDPENRNKIIYSKCLYGANKRFDLMHQFLNRIPCDLENIFERGHEFVPEMNEIKYFLIDLFNFCYVINHGLRYHATPKFWEADCIFDFLKIKR